MKTRKHTTPLLSALAVSMLCTSFVAALSSHGAYQKYNTDGWKQPVICVLMQGLAHGGSSQLPTEDSIGGRNPSLYADSQSNGGEAPGALSGQTDPTVSDGLSARQEQAPNPDSNPAMQPIATGSGNSAGQPDAPAANQPAPPYESNSQKPPKEDSLPPEPKQYAFTDVEQDYFNDALFIGDSRVAGVQLYSGWDNLTYYAENGMTIYNMFQSQTAKIDDRTLTIEEALQERSFGKIYLEIGINEMGTGTVDTFMKAYEEAVAHLRELQPDAILYVCGIMYVKQSKSESDPIFNNPNIQERNNRIAQLADGEHIFYLDINELVTDETGNLNPAYTWDEVHLLGKYDSLWLDYFSSHGIVKDV